MKLYRGLRSDEFIHFTPEIATRLDALWRDVLSDREAGEFDYPDELNDEILEAFKLVRLQRQHFTDRHEVALAYSKENNGLLIELDVPYDDILAYFTIEFQNFAQRKKRFEIVYVADSSKLFSYSKKWKMKTRLSTSE